MCIFITKRHLIQGSSSLPPSLPPSLPQNPLQDSEAYWVHVESLRASTTCTKIIVVIPNCGTQTMVGPTASVLIREVSIFQGVFILMLSHNHNYIRHTRRNCLWRRRMALTTRRSTGQGCACTRRAPGSTHWQARNWS